MQVARRSPLHCSRAQRRNPCSATPHHSLRKARGTPRPRISPRIVAKGGIMDHIPGLGSGRPNEPKGIDPKLNISHLGFENNEVMAEVEFEGVHARQIYQILTNYPEAPRVFGGGLTKVTTQDQGEQIRNTYEGRKFGIGFDYSLVTGQNVAENASNQYDIQWQLDPEHPGPFKENTGSWHLQESTRDDGTVVTSAVMRTKTSFTSSIVSRLASGKFKSEAENVIQNLFKEAVKDFSGA